MTISTKRRGNKLKKKKATKKKVPAKTLELTRVNLEGKCSNTRCEKTHGNTRMISARSDSVVIRRHNLLYNLFKMGAPGKPLAHFCCLDCYNAWQDGNSLKRRVRIHSSVGVAKIAYAFKLIPKTDKKPLQGDMPLKRVV